MLYTRSRQSGIGQHWVTDLLKNLLLEAPLSLRFLPAHHDKLAGQHLVGEAAHYLF